MASPLMSGLSSGPLVPLEADLQPQAMQRSHEFKEGRRVFHVHFGHGFVKSLEAEPAALVSGNGPPPPAERVLTPRTHNINLVFDHPKHKGHVTRLRAFYAIPKMVVIPSSASLRKQKLLMHIGVTPQSEPERIQQVRALLVPSALPASIRAACVLVSRWKLHSHFEPALLLERLVATKCFTAAMHFAREFDLTSSEAFSATALRRKVLRERHYEWPLKHVGATQATVDGEHTPAEVLRLLLGAGHHAVALKYVHKFGLHERFPPQQLVASCLRGEGDLTVRTCGLLLKYVRVFGLEAYFPFEVLLERVTRSGVIVHELDGRYVLKGRRRQAISTPGTSPGTSPPALSSAMSGN